MNHQDSMVGGPGSPRRPHRGAVPTHLGMMKNVCLVAICTLAFLLGVTVLPSIAPAADYFVKTSANGGNDANTGADWSNAKATIGAAMGLITSAGHNIYVAAGTYNEKVTFPGYNNIALKGGYPAGGAPPRTRQPTPRL